MKYFLLYRQTDASLADIYTRCLAGEELNGTEATRFAFFTNSYLAYIEFIWHQQLLELGFVEMGSDIVFKVNGSFIRKLLETKAGQEWWEMDAPNLYLEDFIKKVNHVLE